jgi:glucose/mannose-6-phosphate isomerase
MLVCAAEVAAGAGAAPGLRDEIENAASFLEESSEELRTRAGEISARLEGAVPVVYGAGLTVPVARRWKAQFNENAKLPAFFSELPEATHNEICGWGGSPEGTRLGAVLLEDADQHARERRRFEITAGEIDSAGAPAIRLQTAGATRTERLLWAVMLGDLVSLELATARGVEPLPIEAIDRLKAALGRP